MPIYRAPQYPPTGIAWVDAIVRALATEPDIGPTPFGAPLKLIPSGPAARGLIRQLARRAPKFHKAAQKAPDVIVEYPGDPSQISATGTYFWGQPYYKRLPKVSVTKEAGGREEGPVSALIHELLHHLYAVKNFPRVQRGGLTAKAPFPWHSYNIARRYTHLAPEWLEPALAMKYGMGGPSYWGERAIEGMEALIRQRFVPTAKEAATQRTIKRILE